MEKLTKRVLYNRTEWRNEQGLLHRSDGPAIEWTDGTKYWYLNDQLHRTDGPAIEYADGSKAWYLNDQQIEPWLLNTKIGLLLYD